jgi:hypothetical protein
MSGTGVQIDQVSDDEELLEFVLFADEVNAKRPVYWPAIPGLQIPSLKRNHLLCASCRHMWRSLRRQPAV